ncbi:hypothetical protein F0562_020464 [Nyssa sinensis]|uniref:Dirigent protein n=1 Tax=Nyssa sinensis TaxID=561372 RepID=A0A5J5BSY1_9ASTE|nr:hypothetical protein F0562_020464 [Nyssa sinensis]
MGKLAIILVLCTAAMAIPMVHGIAEEPKAVEAWFEKLSHAKEKVTKLHFYFHDTVSGKNPTAIRVAESNFTSKSPTLFGMIMMIDDPLTEGPEPTSKPVGRAQGFYGSAGLEDLSLLMNINFVFTDATHNGSTLSVLGRNAALHEYREMPIVGGSGDFRLARGIATAKTVSFNATTLDVIVEYNRMEKLPAILMLCSVITAMAMAMPVVQGIAEDPKSVEAWFQKLSHAKEKLTNLHFYFHDNITGNNPTSFQVAQSNISTKSPNLFGAVFIMDDPLTAGPQPTSKIVGRAQGLYASAGMEEAALLMTLNFYFTDGKYNGSTLSVLGRNPLFHQYREMPIVGGSGVFRLVRGIATAKTYWFNVTAGNAIVEYHVIVQHY